MTAASPPLLRDRLGEPTLRRTLARMIRRRVPASDTEDVLQAVLCDALASDRAPATPREIAPWLYGIARNKVADFHRRSRRELTVDDVDAPAPPAPVEARVVLEGIVAEARACPKARETLEWLVREHDGEPLADIAAGARLSPPALRQRVCRMRRALRARWLSPIALLVALGGAARLVAWSQRGPAPIVAEPAPGSRSAALARVQGDWRVASGSARGARVHVAGTLLTVDAPGVHAARAIVVDAADARTMTATLRGERASERATVAIEEDRLVVSGDAGSVVLVR